MNLRDYSSVKERREALEKNLQTDLSHTGNFSLDDKLASSKNCENMIGIAQIPMGIAGPLEVQSSQFSVHSYYIPLATTEGALVASVSRGCKAITESGGASTYACRVGQTRGPVFSVKSLTERQKLYEWIENNQSKLKQIAEQTSRHITFNHAFAKGVEHYLFVRFSFDTADAMGMNMVTIATQAMAEFIEKETGAVCLAVAGNFDIDKKPAWLNFINNRGFPVWAEVVVPKEIVKNVLKTTPEKFFEVWLSKCMIGSAMSGSLGFNAQYANIIAAIFLATGQDPAHIVEGSMGITTARIVKNGDLFVSIYLPALIIGTVGGGTQLATQKEALSVLGISGGDEGQNAEKFAEIIGGAVLAGEISLLASLAENTLAKAHATLGRGKK